MLEKRSMSVLAIVASSVVFDRIRPFLNRSDLEVNRTTNALDGLGLCRHEPRDLVVAQYPMTGFTPRDFFDAYYETDSACAEAPLLVLTRGNRESEIQSYLQDRRARACYLESAHDGHLHQALYELLSVSARCSGRLLATIEVDFGASTVERVYQTVNISKTGLLLKARKIPDPGAVLACRLQLPQSDEPVSTIVEVVRVTDPDKEGFSGFGVRILDFEDDGKQLLSRFVESRLEAPEAGD